MAEKYHADDIAKLKKKGKTMPDGSYPIADKEDLGNAIKAVGMGNADHDAIRRHIQKQAKKLGLESMIPDTWNKDGSLKSASAPAGRFLVRDSDLR
jgi:hypothetical protein